MDWDNIKWKQNQEKSCNVYSPVWNNKLPIKIQWVYSLNLETNYLEMEKCFPSPFEKS